MKNTMPDLETMYDAFVKRDSKYEGIFFVGVKTTGIFCRPTCAARKPHKENIEFFPSAHDALLAGYRPCKICRPLEKEGDTPRWLKPLLTEMERREDLRIKDSEIRKMGIDPNRVRRWFKKNHNMTFQTYLRTMRISSAFGRIKYGDKVIEAAFESGYESLSGFTDSFKKIAGFSPKRSPQKNLIAITRILTPLGPMLAGATEEGICLLEFVDRRMLETQLQRIKKLLNADLMPGTNGHFEELNQQITEFFAGKRKQFTIPLVLDGTAFQKRVWRELMEIPYGNTRSYKEQAEKINSPQAVRAVAKANGDNRIAIIVPCHRVIGSNGKLVGYGGGLWRKQYLLNLEAQNKRHAVPKLL